MPALHSKKMVSIMQRIPVGIRNIRLSTISNLEMVARFEYRHQTLTLEIVDETVLIGENYHFQAIVGKEFGEHEISEWVKSHHGNWDKSLFFIEKIMEHGGAI
jgi:hypothetical protein